MATELVVERLGTVPYAEALELQMKRVEARRAGAAPDALLLLEHPPVITLGRRSKPENLLVSRETLAARGVAVHEVARGGDVTCHAPGQLVGYAILDLAARGEADVHAHLRSLEAGLIDALGELDVAASARPGYTGVFVTGVRPPRKIASIGVGLRGWVTCHGFALNVDVDLAQFEAIVPCGLHDVEMTSITRELGDAAPADPMERAATAVADAFARRWA